MQAARPDPLGTAVGLSLPIGQAPIAMSPLSASAPAHRECLIGAVNMDVEWHEFINDHSRSVLIGSGPCQRPVPAARPGDGFGDWQVICCLPWREFLRLRRLEGVRGER